MLCVIPTALPPQYLYKVTNFGSPFFIYPSPMLRVSRGTVAVSLLVIIPRCSGSGKMKFILSHISESFVYKLLYSELLNSLE